MRARETPWTPSIRAAKKCGSVQSLLSQTVSGITSGWTAHRSKMIQTQHNNSLLPLEVFKAQGENNRDSAGSGGRQVHNSSSTGMSHETRVIASRGL